MKMEGEGDPSQREECETCDAYRWQPAQPIRRCDHTRNMMQCVSSRHQESLTEGGSSVGRARALP
jgi:hypothetical protein